MEASWKNTLVESDSLILDVLNIIDRTASKAAFVVDKENHLIGMVTDGDIRRGLIKGVDLQSRVSEVMNTAPLTCSSTDSNQAILRLMEAKDILHMPIVEEGGRLISVLSKKELEEKQYCDSPVFLMAGGLGTRLGELTEDCPKPLLKVGKKPILETILESFIDHGFHRFYISTYYLSEKVKEYFGDGSRWQVSIEYTDEPEPLGTGGALSLLPKDLPNLPLIMMNGDILTNVNYRALLEYHQEAGADATICVRQHQYQVPYGVVQASDFKIKHIEEKPVNRYYINAGIYVIDPLLIRDVKPDKSIDMPDLLNEKLDNGADIVMYPIDEYWIDVGRISEFQKAQQDIRSLY